VSLYRGELKCPETLPRVRAVIEHEKPALSWKSVAPNSFPVIRCDRSKAAVVPTTAPCGSAGASMLVKPRTESSALTQDCWAQAAAGLHLSSMGTGNDHHPAFRIGSSINACTPANRRNAPRSPSEVPRLPYSAKASAIARLCFVSSQYSSSRLLKNSIYDAR
jgi:hypothetical protein